MMVTQWKICIVICNIVGYSSKNSVMTISTTLPAKAKTNPPTIMNQCIMVCPNLRNLSANDQWLTAYPRIKRMNGYSKLKL